MLKKTFNIIILSFFIHLCSIDVQEIQYTWSKPYATYVFAPGLWTSEHQAVKYCKRYSALNKQLLEVLNSNFEIINGPYCRACNFAEIQLIKLDDLKPFSNSVPALINRAQNFFLYSLASRQISKSNNYYGITISGNPEGYLLNPYLIDYRKLNFGQKLDIEIFAKFYDQVCKDKNMPQDIVLFGTSRGAATIFNFMAFEYQKKEPRVKAIILESCFDMLPNLFPFDRYPFLLNVISALTIYKKDSIATPIHQMMIKVFTALVNLYNIPVLLVTSTEDARVPAHNTQALCHALIEAGCKKVYYLELDKGDHSGYMKDEQTAQRYQAVVHAFYKKHGLSHISYWAQQGQKALELCQKS